MERGFTTAAGLIGGPKVESRVPQLIFVVPGEPTSLNPIKAFQQGASGEPEARRYFVFGSRCSACGFLELYAAGEHTSTTTEI
jgi:hypothetical protein